MTIFSVYIGLHTKCNNVCCQSRMIIHEFLAEIYRTIVLVMIEKV